MKKQNGFATHEIIILIIGVVSAGGWIANIVKLIESSFDPLTGMVVARAIGIFVAPIGIVLGFI